MRVGQEVSGALRRLFELPSASRIELSDLGAEQIRELLATTLGPCQPSDRLLTDIGRASGGNVYFILEILRSMITRGVITRMQSGAVLPDHLDEADAPKSLGEALLTRL